jgi:MoxR-like ATPase
MSSTGLLRTATGEVPRLAKVDYNRLFDPDLLAKGKLVPVESVGDRAPPQAFLFDDNLVLAVNVALATSRPLLLRGPSGVGKSSVARAVAWHENWSYVQITVTSRTLARDFLYQLDDLKRLQDAYAQRPLDDMLRYLVPGPLFWAFDPNYAKSILIPGRGTSIPTGIFDGAENTVVLIDEIDKADPDVPNNLLEPLGRLSFEGVELPRPVVASARRVPLIVLTTNEERDLPDAFLRRCIEHRIDPPNPERMRQIGEAHFQQLDPSHHDLAISFEPASPAEYLDAIRACRRLSSAGQVPDDLKSIVSAVLGPKPEEGAY